MDFSLSTEKQKLLIEYMISSSDIFSIVYNIVNHKLFDPEFRNSVKFIKQYYQEYNAIPDIDIIQAESGMLYNIKENIPHDKKEYIILEIEKYCKNENFRLVLLQAADYLVDGKYDLETIKEYFNKKTDIGISKSLGKSIFNDIEELLENVENDDAISTGYKSLDDAIGGGFQKHSLNIFAASSGVGKSLILYNISMNLSKQGYNVLIISLELSIKMIFQRLSANITKINPNNMKKNTNEVLVKMKMAKKSHGDVIVEYMKSGSSANDIRSFINESQLKFGRVFDAIVVDYLDELSPNDKSIPASDISTRDKAIASEIRNLSVEFNCPILSASQHTKDAENVKELNQSNLSGGKYKSNISDLLVYIISPPSMKQQGFMDLHIMKNRTSDGVGKIVNMLWDSNSMRIYEPENDDDLQKIEKRKSMNNSELKKSKNDDRNALMDRFKNGLT